MREVDCSGCASACCRRDTIGLSAPEAERLAGSWHWERWPDGIERATLNRRADGACVFVSPRGCSIHAERPDTCRRFDCRAFFAATPKAQRRAMAEANAALAPVFLAAKRRLHTLEAR